LGKPHALHTGVTAAKGDLFWMVDADTRHDPKGLKTAVSFMDSRDIDLFSLIPRLEAGSFWEKTVQPLFYAWFDGRMMKRINDPLKSDVAACGPYFLVKRSCYEKVGGFEAQKDKLLEDLEFARAVKSAGCRFFLADGMKLYSLRMYSGISGLWKGWTKTFGGGLSGKRWLGVILALLLLFFSVSPFVFPIVVLSKMISGCSVSYKSVIMTFLPVMLLFMFRFRNDKFNMQDRRYIPTHPAGAIFLAAVMLKAGFSGSGVEWKGRKYTENGTIGGKYS
jgi:glycosyltransferase involved in cell wall biosynthesis